MSSPAPALAPQPRAPKWNVERVMAVATVVIMLFMWWDSAKSITDAKVEMESTHAAQNAAVLQQVNDNHQQEQSDIKGITDRLTVIEGRLMNQSNGNGKGGGQ